MSFISYASNFEDVMLWRAFKHIKQGFYIDVGAGDPTLDSVTKAFYERGWSGINIEPLVSHYKDLQDERPRDINLCCAVGKTSGEIEIFEFDVRGWATAEKSVADKLVQEGHEAVYHRVPLRTLSDICQEYVSGEIHFLKIDVEGLEKDVISGADFQKFRPWVLVVEATKPNTIEETYEQWEGLLLAVGYQFAYADGLNHFYVASERADLLPAFKYPPNVFDDFVLEADELNRVLAERIKQAQSLTEWATSAETYAKALEVEVARLRAEHAVHESGIETLKTQQMASIGVFTIASKNYLAYVRVLMTSLIKVHPEYKLYLCLADRLDGYFSPATEPYTIVEAEQLGIPNFGDFTLRYDIMEFNTAVKPFMFRWLFNNTDLDAVIYLDPDIQAFSKFDHLETMLNDGASVVLTPHITQPLEDDKNPNDYNFLQTGVFNLGFIAIQRCDESLAFIDWWGRRLSRQCIVDFQASLFVDQKWCDLANCFLDKLKILRDVGYNTAYWNLAQRKISKAKNGQWLVNQSPLVFYHFSGVNPSDLHLVSKHQNRFSWKDIPEVQALFRAYNDALMQAGWKESRNWPYVFDEMCGWKKVNRLVRMLYRTVQPQPADVELDKIGQYIRNICNQPCPDVRADSEVRVSRLMFFIYRTRGDLQSTLLLDTAKGRKQFASWFERAGLQEYDLPPELTQQHLIQERDLLLPGKKVTYQVYRIISAMELIAIKMAKVLPSGLRKNIGRFWFALKSHIIRAF
jgi:FkbM family methyltransferase